MSGLKLRAPSTSIERRLRRKVAYHHTSVLRTNLIWMSGCIQVEGYVPPIPAMHPMLGPIIKADPAAYRRDCKDFPPLAWFTLQTTVPRVLTDSVLNIGLDRETGEETGRQTIPREQAYALALNRVALGFPTAGLTPWPRYYGYSTPEGKELNESARDVGDDPGDWYVSELPVDVMLSTEVWLSASIFPPRLRRHPTYLNNVRKMVTLCRDAACRGEQAFIPPSWLPPEPTTVEALKQAFPNRHVEIAE